MLSKVPVRGSIKHKINDLKEGVTIEVKVMKFVLFYCNSFIIV